MTLLASGPLGFRQRIGLVDLHHEAVRILHKDHARLASARTGRAAQRKNVRPGFLQPSQNGIQVADADRKIRRARILKPRMRRRPLDIFVIDQLHAPARARNLHHRDARLPAHGIRHSADRFIRSKCRRRTRQLQPDYVAIKLHRLFQARHGMPKIPQPDHQSRGSRLNGRRRSLCPQRNACASRAR